MTTGGNRKDDEKGPGNGGGWDPNGQSESDVATETEKKLKQPQLYRVLLHNDDYTTMEFVVAVLIDIFHHKEEDAVRIMLHVHHQGVGVAGVFSFEIAETKVRQTTERARANEYPLRCTMEPDD
jgi:ATP-dependent Clp protease adaptor protein ClpS